MFRVDDVDEMSDIAEKISTELRNQYVIGYKPKISSATASGVK